MSPAARSSVEIVSEQLIC